MAAVPRDRFLPLHQRPWAHLDRPLSIGYDATNSQPSTVRRMLEWLNVHPGHRVLDVGAGSGWTSALLGHLVGPTGRVIGVEIVPELCERAADVIADLGLPWVQIRLASQGVLGDPGDAPYDRILVSAAPTSLPDELVAQLADGGVMVIPVGHRMTVVHRHGTEISTHEASGRYAFVPLRMPGTST